MLDIFLLDTILITIKYTTKCMLKILQISFRIQQANALWDYFIFISQRKYIDNLYKTHYEKRKYIMLKWKWSWK